MATVFWDKRGVLQNFVFTRQYMANLTVCELNVVFILNKGFKKICIPVLCLFQTGP